MTYTLINFGRSYTTWRKPFNQLVTYGNSAGAGGIASATSEEIQMDTAPTGVPATPAANTIVEESIDEQAVLQSVQTTPVGIAVSVLSGARPPMSVPMRGKGVDRV